MNKFTSQNNNSSSTKSRLAHTHPKFMTPVGDEITTDLQVTKYYNIYNVTI